MDANAISPETAMLVGGTVTGAGARYVDGGIIGPPPVTAGTTRLYLAGDDGEVANLFAGSALDVVSLAGAPPAASALKMTYAAWTKTTAALLVSIRDTAAAYGVDVDLATEWAMSQPHLEDAWRRAREQTQEKGWRWAYELAEVGRTFAAVGQPEGFGAAASEVFTSKTSHRGASARCAVAPVRPIALRVPPFRSTARSRARTASRPVDRRRRTAAVRRPSGRS